jgi:hypothetical protein
MELAHRFDKACQQFFRLRNETTRFLIRSQGPALISSDEARYYQSLDEVGFRARDAKKDLDQELKSIWHDLQKVNVKAENIANYQ